MLNRSEQNRQPIEMKFYEIDPANVSNITEFGSLVLAHLHLCFH